MLSKVRNKIEPLFGVFMCKMNNDMYFLNFSIILGDLFQFKKIKTKNLLQLWSVNRIDCQCHYGSVQTWY